MRSPSVTRDDTIAGDRGPCIAGLISSAMQFLRVLYRHSDRRHSSSRPVTAAKVGQRPPSWQNSLRVWISLVGHQSSGVRKVSQLATSPDFKPVMNQRVRCAEVPWVNASGTT
jgi:hypothetical protein